MEELTKGEIKRRQKWDKYNQNIIEQFAEYGLEARLIDKDDQKHLTKIEKWRYIMRVYQQRYGQKINNIRTLNNDMLAVMITVSEYSPSTSTITTVLTTAFLQVKL